MIKKPLSIVTYFLWFRYYTLHSSTVLSGNIWQELELEPEPKIWTKGEPEPKINNFGSATLQKTRLRNTSSQRLESASRRRPIPVLAAPVKKEHHEPQ